MTFRISTYQELVSAHRDLPLRSLNSHLIASLFGAGEADFAVVLLLQHFDLGQTSQKLAVIKTIDVDGLCSDLRVLTVDHLQNFSLDELKILGVSSGSPANHIVNTAVIVIATHSATIHGIRELDEDRMLLHDALDVLATDTDNALMVLIRDVEGDGSGHLLLHQSQTLLHRGVVVGQDIDVEVVLAEVIEDDLDVAVAHDLVDLAVLLSAHKFLVLIGEFDLNTNLVLSCGEELDLRQDLESLLDGLIRPSKRKGDLIKGNIGIGVGANVAEQGPELLRAGKQARILLADPPRGMVKLASLK